MIRQNSFLALAQQQKQLRKEKFLEEMEKVIPWGEFCKVIEPYYEEKKTGRKKMEMIMMLKIYFLQQWYNLSDPAVEKEVYDRGSFQKFLSGKHHIGETRTAHERRKHSGCEKRIGASS